MHKFMMWLTAKLKVRQIYIDDEAYLERYYLCTLFGKRIFIHRFMGDDPDRGIHSHPWRWAFSIMLSGQYYETVLHNAKEFGVMYVDIKVRKAPTFNFISGIKMHRITVEKKDRGRTWTLFFHGKRDREWGFMSYTADKFGIVSNSHYEKADTPAEREQNEQWYNRKDTIRGRDLRIEDER